MANAWGPSSFGALRGELASHLSSAGFGKRTFRLRLSALTNARLMNESWLTTRLTEYGCESWLMLAVIRRVVAYGSLLELDTGDSKGELSLERALRVGWRGVSFQLGE